MTVRELACRLLRRRDERPTPTVTVTRIAVTREQVAQARRDSLARAGVTVTVSDALRARAAAQGRQRRGQA